MKRYTLLVIIFVCGYSMSVKAQQYDLTFYHMKSIPQAYQSNPASVPDCKWYVGFPLFSSLYTGFGHTGFTTGSFMERTPGGKTFISQADLLDALNGKNHIFMDFNQEWLSFGFRSSMNYFHFSLTEKFMSRFTYPKEFIEFLLKGNGSDSFFDNPEGLSFSDFNLDVAHYRELALTFSSFINPRFTIGARPKFLFGLMNVITKYNDIKQYTDTFSLKGEADMLVNSSLPLAVHNEDVDFDFGEYYFNMNNFGFGIDLGANYKLNEKIDISGSLTDFGFISFRTNPYHYKMKNGKSVFEFTGLDLVSAFSDSTTNFNGLTSDITDSLQNTFEVYDTIDPYNWGLIPKIYLAGTYKLDDKSFAGIVLRSEFYSSAMHPGISLSYHRKFGDVFNLTGSYTIINDCYTNFGLGFSLQLGPWQMYCTTDNLFAPLVYSKYKWSETDEWGYKEEQSVSVPSWWKNMNVHFGMNFIFGYKRIKAVSMPSM